MVTVTVTTKATKNLQHLVKTGSTFSTNSTSYVDITGMTALTSVTVNSLVGCSMVFSKSSTGTGSTRITEATPVGTYAVTSVAPSGTDNIFASALYLGATSNVKLQAKSSDAANVNIFQAVTSIFSSTFGGGVAQTGSALTDTIHPYKMNITDIDVICVGTSNPSSGHINGVGVYNGNLENNKSSASPNSVLTDGLHYATNNASLGIASSAKTMMVYDFIGSTIQVSA